MNIGASVRTLPTVKPRTYARKVGTVVTVNDGEIGVLVNGRVVWFLEKEIEEHGPANGNPRDNGHTRGATNRPRVDAEEPPVSQSRASRLPGSVEATSPVAKSGQTVGALPAPAATTDKRLGTQERAREANPASPDSPVSADSRGEEGPRALSEPKPVSGALRGSGEEQQLILGARGPAGGVVARCAACRATWERERRRGRPSLVCPRCR